ncbi:GntR family transcriptional regulator [Marinobacter salarius]
MPDKMLATPLRTRERNYTVTLTEQAYKEIEELIVTLQLPPGEVLSESSLTKQLAIGRTPIREALQRLALEGLVVILPRRGIFVSEVNVRSQLELLRVRREIERLMVRLAASRATALEHERFLHIADAMVKTSDSNDDVEFMRLDQEFNSLVSSTCRNEYARKSMGLLQGLARRFWYQHYKETLDLPLCASLHANLARAIGRGDGNGAAEALDKLIDYIEQFARATV